MSEQWDREVWPKLRGSGCLWHSTSLAGCARIISTGEIMPNTGQFAVSSNQSLNSWSRHLEGVSLFYFDEATDQDIHEHGWDYSFLKSSAVRVMIKIDPNQLDQSLLYLPRDLGTAIAALTGEHIGRRIWVPYLEAIYRAAVPAIAFVGFCAGAFVDSQRLLWQEVPATSDAQETIEETARAWSTKWPQLSRGR